MSPWRLAALALIVLPAAAPAQVCLGTATIMKYREVTELSAPVLDFQPLPDGRIVFVAAAGKGPGLSVQEPCTHLSPPTSAPHGARCEALVVTAGTSASRLHIAEFDGATYITDSLRSLTLATPRPDPNQPGQPVVPAGTFYLATTRRSGLAALCTDGTVVPIGGPGPWPDRLPPDLRLPCAVRVASDGGIYLQGRTKDRPGGSTGYIHAPAMPAGQWQRTAPLLRDGFLGLAFGQTSARLFRYRSDRIEQTDDFGNTWRQVKIPLDMAGGPLKGIVATSAGPVFWDKRGILALYQGEIPAPSWSLERLPSSIPGYPVMVRATDNDVYALCTAGDLVRIPLEP